MDSGVGGAEGGEGEGLVCEIKKIVLKNKINNTGSNLSLSFPLSLR